MKPSKSFLIVILVLTVLSWFFIDYFWLPAYNFQSFGFWFLLGTYAFLILSLVGNLIGMNKSIRLGIMGGGGILVLAIVLSLGSWLFWPGNDARLYSQLEVSERNGDSFLADFPGTGSPTGGSLLLPVLDKELSTTIAQGKMGNYGAQFQMNTEIFTAITVVRSGKREIVRVSPLDYSGIMVALSGGARGTAGYIEVNQISEASRLVEVTGGMKYTPEAVFAYDLTRHIRFKYHGELLGSYSFEIDDSGKPYWIVPVLKKDIGLFGGLNQKATILVDPVSGAMDYFERGTEPEWVDRVFPTDIAMTQANNRLGLKNGWPNKIFGEKREVFQLSDGYNYVFSDSAQGSGTWFVSGVTSPNEADQTLVGFLMINMRTREARRYTMSGITEMRAMEIAQNDERVRAQGLLATWPILVEVDGQAAYFMFLKNSVQRQRFVYLDVVSGQHVAMADSIEGAKGLFAQMIGSTVGSSEALASTSAVVFRVRQNPADGTISFLLTGEQGILYTVNSSLSSGVSFMAAGDSVAISYRESAANPGQRFVVELRNKSLGE